MLEMCAKYFLAVKMSRYLLNEQGRNCLSNFSETFSNICLILLLTFCKLFFFRIKININSFLLSIRIIEIKQYYIKVIRRFCFSFNLYRVKSF